MKLHQDKRIFTEAVLATAEHFKIQEVFIEKDYWVTNVLKNLSMSKHKGVVVFKGGTSLSKAYKLITRFSEDIDLAIIQADGMSGNAVKNMIKEVEAEISKGLKEIDTPGVTSKGSKFRKVVFEYPRVIEANDFGHANEKLLIEINSFANPHPHSEMPVQSMITDFLLQNGNNDIIEANELSAFTVNVLGLERTFTEKVLSLVRASYSENSISELTAKVRHIYDLHFILKRANMREFVSGEGFKKMIQDVLSDDEKNSQFQGEWTKKPLNESIVFADWDNTWQKLQQVYTNQFKGLTFSDFPDVKAIDESMKIIIKSAFIKE